MVAPALRESQPRGSEGLGWFLHADADAAVVSDGTCPRVTPLVLIRKNRTPGDRGPHTVPPVLADGLSVPFRIPSSRGLAGLSGHLYKETARRRRATRHMAGTLEREPLRFPLPTFRFAHCLTLREGSK